MYKLIKADLLGHQQLLETEKLSVSIFAPAPLCIGFLEGNLSLVFLTTRGLLLLSRSGICSSRISVTSQAKKKVFLLAQDAETWE